MPQICPLDATTIPDNEAKENDMSQRHVQPAAADSYSPSWEITVEIAPAEHCLRTSELAGARFAALLESDHDAILASFRSSLIQANNPLMDETDASRDLMSYGSGVLSNITTSVRAGISQITLGYRFSCSAIDEALDYPNRHITPMDSVHAATTFFTVAVDSLAAYVSSDPELIPCFVLAILTLNESTALWVRRATNEYAEFLLSRIQRVEMSERRRLARDLHDHIGEGLSTALRQLELEEMAYLVETGENSPQALIGKNALTNAMRRLRLVISDLRHEQAIGLEKALIHYLHGIEGQVSVKLRVRGEEHWASPTVIDETYLIIREALRNALAHGTPRTLLVDVGLSPHELRASIKDDGCGFVVGATRSDSSAGLASMRERAATMGGNVTVTSEPGHGTSVELLVPLPEDRHG
jgi:signal transduction histidine kinase